MMHRDRTKDGQRKVTPPGPTYMSDDQVAKYLKDLRTNRPARPNGSRPLPGKTASPMHTPRNDLPPRATSALSHRSPEVNYGSPEEYPRAASAMSSRRTSFRLSLGSSAGRPLVQEPMSVSVRKFVSPTKVAVKTTPVSPSATYREIRQRQKEREEARSLRDALEEMDLQEESRLHEAAQDEATELVWSHQHGGKPLKNPYAPYRNPALSAKGADAKSRDTGGHGLGIDTSGSSTLQKNGHRSVSDSSAGSDRSVSNGSARQKNRVNFALPEQAQQIPPAHGLSASASRKGSGDSSRGIFRNPNDLVYEPEGADKFNGHVAASKTVAGSESSAVKVKPRNNLPQGSRPLPERSGKSPFLTKLSRFEIHRNPPSQSRNPAYTTNDPVPPTDRDPRDRATLNQSPVKEGLEIRSADLRAATSKKFRDRSDNLPTPSAVSDRPGRPIVSFDPSWEPVRETSLNSRETAGRQETVTVSPPEIVVPAIEVSETPAIPVISVSPDREPTISEMVSSQKKTGSEQKPTASGATAAARPFSTSQNSSRTSYTRAGVPTASCAACQLPIEGKIVTAAGSRFHPECFVCHHCHTALECVGFYQEPEAKRAERLADASNDDNDAQAPRFYCHLDFHEMFSPRCKSCKTPIEGEVVVACGAEWHVGHFFCAECGDPFTSTTPFVEKEGFAWCLRCHSRRTAPRCLGCKQAVLDEVVITAIGGQWHDKCFVCHECGDGFGPEGRFFVREGEPRRTAKGRIIGGPVQLAVCERCEAVRLKASP